MVLFAGHIAREHSQYRLNLPLTKARDIVAMGRSRDLGNTESLIDLVSEKAKQISATVGVQDLGATTAPNEQKKSPVVVAIEQAIRQTDFQAKPFNSPSTPFFLKHAVTCHFSCAPVLSGEYFFSNIVSFLLRCEIIVPFFCQLLDKCSYPLNLRKYIIDSSFFAFDLLYVYNK
jgi:hypothetical protein